MSSATSWAAASPTRCVANTTRAVIPTHPSLALILPHHSACRVLQWQVRYDSNVTPECRVKFMTEGILLREVASDLLLSR